MNVITCQLVVILICTKN